jgi:hypothetical protein
MPDRDTVYGFMARMTPLSLHVAFRKYTQRDRHAGQPGHGPYPTFYDPIVSRRGIHGYCVAHGLTISAEYGAGYYLKRKAARALRAFALLVHLASGRRLAMDHNNLTYVLEKPAPSPGDDG